MDSIKIKTNLPKKVYDTLINDMEAFNFVKADGTVNKNGFINALIKSYFGEFSKSELDAISKADGKIKMEIEDYPLISSLFFEERFKKEGNYSKDIQFIIQKENMDIYDEITDLYLRSRSVSQYFREMFILYSLNQQDKREEIIFKSIYKKIDSAVKSKKQSLVYFKNNIKKPMELYCVASTKEGMFDYIMAVDVSNKNRDIISFHLKDVSNVIILKDKDVNFSKQEIEKLDLSIEQCPAFPVNEIIDAKVELTDIGIKLFNLYIHDRPHPYKVEGNIYYFKSSLAHLAIYFFKFASEAKFLSPKKIGDFIKERFLKAYNQY